MSGERAGIFDTDGEFDVSGFKPQPAERPAARPEQVRAVSEAAQFRSREAKPVAVLPATPPRREQRRHRTGRNVQINIKARAETLEAFYAIADGQGWVLGEAFEHAVEALQRQLAR